MHSQCTYIVYIYYMYSYNIYPLHVIYKYVNSSCKNFMIIKLFYCYFPSEEKETQEKLNNCPPVTQPVNTGVRFQSQRAVEFELLSTLLTSLKMMRQRRMLR